MRAFKQQIENFFTTQTVWLHLTVMLLLSYFLLISSIENNGGNYLVCFVILVGLYLPMSLFNLLRTSKRIKISSGLYALLWLAIFIFLPVFYWWKGPEIASYVFPHSIHQGRFRENQLLFDNFYQTFFLIAFVLFLALEISLWLGKRISDRSPFTRKSIWSADRMLIIVLLIIVGIFSAVGAWEETKENGDQILQLLGRFFLYYPQFLVFAAVYYFYYYINRAILIPKLLKQKGLVYYGAGFVGSILIFYPIFVFIFKQLPILDILNVTTYSADSPIFSNGGGFTPFLVLLLSLPIIVSNQWFQQNKEISDLNQQKAEMELSILKQQINPHFFFNTLNNLYALSMTKDERAPKVILQLSQLMRYVIYEGQEEFVPLHRDLAYVEDYIDLQKIRLHHKMDYQFTKEIQDPSLAFPPLLFIILVENAFKHGIEPARGETMLHMKLVQDQKRLQFSCKNSLEVLPQGKAGIGMKNLRQRLDLHFPEQYSFHTESDSDSYLVTLTIEL
ncbi:MAG: sensor histidine kinase [Bacteroidota bacterium]